MAAGRVPPARALEFGLALSALSFVLLASTVNVLTAALALVGNLFYVLVYTRWLKRSTPQNIVIGGAAGAVPPLVGWAAATGNLGAARALALPDRLLLDAAALLGARAADQGELRGARRCRCCRSSAATRETTRQIVSTRSCSSRSRSCRRLWLGAGLLGRGALVLGARLPLAGVAAPAGADAARARRALPLLARLPRAALRRDGR